MGFFAINQKLPNSTIVLSLFSSGSKIVKSYLPKYICMQIDMMKVECSVYVFNFVYSCVTNKIINSNPVAEP